MDLYAQDARLVRFRCALGGRSDTLCAGYALGAPEPLRLDFDKQNWPNAWRAGYALGLLWADLGI